MRAPPAATRWSASASPTVCRGWNSTALRWSTATVGCGAAAPKAWRCTIRNRKCRRRRRGRCACSARAKRPADARCTMATICRGRRAAFRSTSVCSRISATSARATVPSSSGSTRRQRTGAKAAIAATAACRRATTNSVRWRATATPWWRRGWALALYAAALVAFGLGVGRLRARALAARARDLARQVEQRTRDLAEANRRLERASLTDPLTGLWNRRYFALEMPPECERARRRHALGEPASDLVLLLVDIDHFKRVNDRCGLAVGDAVLTEFARRLQRLMRGGDFAVRWGGEEFLLVLRDAERAAAAAFAARVRGATGTEPFSIDARTIALTCSVGWAAFPPRGDAAATGSIERTIALADQALYRAKQAGRDRCCGALDDAAPPDGVRWVES